MYVLPYLLAAIVSVGRACVLLIQTSAAFHAIYTTHTMLHEYFPHTCSVVHSSFMWSLSNWPPYMASPHGDLLFEALIINKKALQ